MKQKQLQIDLFNICKFGKVILISYKKHMHCSPMYGRADSQKKTSHCGALLLNMTDVAYLVFIIMNDITKSETINHIYLCKKENSNL